MGQLVAKVIGGLGGGRFGGENVKYRTNGDQDDATFLDFDEMEPRAPRNGLITRVSRVSEVNW